MTRSVLVYITLITILLFTISPITKCNGLARKLSKSSSPSSVSLICGKVTHTKFCAQTLGSDPRSKTTRDPSGLAHIALEKLEAHSKVIIKYMHQFAAAADLEKIVMQGCIQLYEAAGTKDVAAALAALKRKDYGAAKKAVGLAMKDGQGCQTLIDENYLSEWDGLTVKNKYTNYLSRLSSDLIGLSGH